MSIIDNLSDEDKATITRMTEIMRKKLQRAEHQPMTLQEMNAHARSFLLGYVEYCQTFQFSEDEMLGVFCSAHTALHKALDAYHADPQSDVIH